VMVPSTFVADDLVRRGVEPSRIELIPYGVDVERFSAPERDFSARPLEVLYIGQVGYRKGLRYLGAAVGAVSPPPKQVTVIGPIVNRSVALAQTLRHFAYLGKVAADDLPQYYARADVFILPSLAEGMALVVLEAMASGLPVIVTEESGYAGVIRDGVEGFIVGVRDSAAIAQKLSLLSEDGDLRRRMGVAARARACGYTWARFEQTATDRLVERLRKGA
jgi:glycosyltransferase involved in cell wall biosynthesis